MRRFPRHVNVSILLAALVLGRPAAAQMGTSPDKLFVFDTNVAATRWSSPENPDARGGQGALKNHGAKGAAFTAIAPGASLTLLDAHGPGVVNRIWITIGDRSPAMLRSLIVQMFWDNAKTPAVSVPFGDFFGFGLTEPSPFHSALFASPEGRSFVATIPMPFKTAARIVIVNESKQKIDHIFYDVDFQALKAWQRDNLYFHATWHRDTATTLGAHFELLPQVHGKGRFLGVTVNVNTNPIYRDSWWGEGEVQMYLDGDASHPSLSGTGTEDYFWTGWGQGPYTLPNVGCVIASGRSQQWDCYRYHIPDPIFFRSGCRVTLQQIGGNDISKVRAMQDDHIPLIPVSLDSAGVFYPLYTPGHPVQLSQAKLPSHGWLNFYRSDDVAATAYFYLATPTNNLPPLQPVAIRTYHVAPSEGQ